MRQKGNIFLITVLIIVLLLIGIGGFVYFKGLQNKSANNTSDNKPSLNLSTISQEEKVSSSDIRTAKFIFANPFDLSQIKRISKYRSCVGHDSMAENVEGENEPYRSLKHYIDSGDFKVGGSEKIKAFAPFDGKIELIVEEGGFGSEVLLRNDSMPEGWLFSFFHLDLLPKFKQGSEVKGGELIGYQSPTVTYFDVAVRMFADRESGKSFKVSELKRLAQSQHGDIRDIKFVYSPVFEHMSEEVLTEYSEKGIIKESTVVSKEERDNSPCKCEGGIEKLECNFEHDNRSDADWVYLK